MIHKLAAVLGEVKPTSTGEYNACCPFCVKRTGKRDTGFHLYVNPTRFIHGIRGWYYCHRCQARGPLHRLLGKNSPGRAVPEDWTKFVQTLRGTRAADADKVKKPEITLPEDYVSIIKGTKAHGYLMERGISDEQIAFYQIGFGTQDLREVDSAERHKFAGSGRIIFPDFDSDGRCIYWVARTYMGHKIKYKNPARSNARDQVYNLAKASQFTACIIAEGVISAIACGYNGVATYGKEVTKEQVSMLVAAAFDHYIVAHDGDARRTSLTLAQRLMRRGCTVSLVEFARDQDPASVPDIRDRLDRALPYSLKNHLVFRLEENKVL